jgi:hypothetical protein
VRLNERCIVLLFAGFKQDSPGCFRGSSGLSPTILLSNLHNVHRCGCVYILIGVWIQWSSSVSCEFKPKWYHEISISSYDHCIFLIPAVTWGGVLMVVVCFISLMLDTAHAAARMFSARKPAEPRTRDTHDRARPGFCVNRSSDSDAGRRQHNVHA